jgi:hypothetical protein
LGYEKVMAGMPTVAADIRHTYSPWGAVMQYPPRLKHLEEPVPHLMVICAQSND